MKLIKTILQLIAVRPFIIIFPAAVTLLLCLIDLYNPFVSILMGLSSVTGGNISDSIISFLQIVTDSAYLPLAGLAAAVAIVVASLLGSVLLSGYLNILNNACLGKQKYSGEFFHGVKTFFSRFLGINLVILLLAVLTVTFLTVAAVPAVIASRAALTTRGDLLLPSILLDIITVFVVIFGSLFFRAYMFFWYPAAVNSAKGSFSSTRSFVNKYFWKIAVRLLALDLFFAVTIIPYFMRVNSITFFLLDWMLKTCYFVMLAGFVFFRYTRSGYKTFN